MGAVFALIFSFILFFFALLFLVIGLLLRRRNKVIAIVLYCLAGAATIPMLLMAAIVGVGFVGSRSAEREHERECGKLITAIVYRRSEKALALIDSGYDISLVDRNGNTALHEACKVDDRDVVKALLQRKMDIDVENAYHETALLSCVHYMDNEMLDILLRNGANVNTVNDDGDNAILRISKNMSFGKDKYDNLKMLLNYGCDAQRKDAYGKTAKEYVRDFIEECEKTVQNYQDDSDYKNAVRLLGLLEAGA